jgi:hypothetical protein
MGSLALLDQRELHFARAFHDFGSVENFESCDAAVITEIGNHPGAHLITLLYACVAQSDGKDISLLVVIDSNRGLSGFIFRDFDVL